MGNRYLVSGVQIGMLREFAMQKRMVDIQKLTNDILEEQFVYHSNLEIEEDAKKIREKSKEF